MCISDNPQKFTVFSEETEVEQNFEERITGVVLASSTVIMEAFDFWLLGPTRANQKQPLQINMFQESSLETQDSRKETQDYDKSIRPRDWKDYHHTGFSACGDYP